VPLRSGKTLREDFYDGMLHPPRSLPAKYFYDQVGSSLFDKICDSPEYYPTRTESRLLKEISSELIGLVKPGCITEFGSGTARKTRFILDACQNIRCHPVYNPVDVCAEVLVESSEDLRKQYDWLTVNPLVGDYTMGFLNFPHLSDRNLFVFLGGTIGNFSETDSLRFLSELRQAMSEGDSLLIGADRVKSPKILHAAYNDAEGITAKFNLNLLNVLNRRLGASFQIENFAHYALYNPITCQIEMYLMSMQQQTVEFNSIDESILFGKGDCILTEVSRKFTRESLESLMVSAGFQVRKHFEVNKPEFSLVLAEPS